MRTKPKYDLTCPVARTLDVVGERWTILILRDLFKQGPLRYQDLERSLEGVSPNTLSARLKSLMDRGIIDRRFYEEHPPRAEYFLTEKGRTLGPILRALYEWGRSTGSEGNAGCRIWARGPKVFLSDSTRRQRLRIRLEGQRR